MPDPRRFAWNDPTTVARFRARCAPCVLADGCACILFDGYTERGWGRIAAHGFPGCPGARVLAHRYAFALAHGPAAAGDDVHHRHDVCRHRNCVNPAHLEAVEHGAHGGLSSAQRWDVDREDADAFDAPPESL